MKLLALLALLQGPSRVELDAVREAVVRSVVADADPGYFVAHCVSLVPGIVPTASESERLERLTNAEPVDADPTLLARLDDLPHRFIPGSGCAETKEGDVVERSPQRGPALLVTLGPLERRPQDQMIVMVYTSSGFMTETFTEYELARDTRGRWRVVRERIVLQA